MLDLYHEIMENSYEHGKRPTPETDKFREEHNVPKDVKLYTSEIHISTDFTRICEHAEGDLAQSVY